ncbi:flotillin family protein [Thetidibacter halocola]|uniref:Flotillin n=1 Tax=Thetidibacter halocola TaxID=2827239 RepID=A0A8J8B875_9RHOB|nr:flotillin domain-containing protein [Thetidibacter halocola]MBS0124459.1 flotillin [Thetidibacter halocola]
MSGLLTTLVVLVVLAIVVVVILARLYRKATREVSLIRTGLGGQRIIMAGGAIALPYFHEVTEVNMRTLRLEVKRSGEDSLITKDRLRVDIAASFSVAVEAAEAAIAKAAQTLGDRTFNADRLRDVVEGKLVDALRAVAAKMTLDELHEGRAEFVREVRGLIADDLGENGLRLQSVSLTALDQTPFAALDENNVFNAVGMRKLAEVIAKSKKERAQIDAETSVAVSLAAMEATRRTLEIERDEQQARIAQHQEIETLKAAQTAEIARRRADAEREAEAARIGKEKAVKEAEVARDRAVRAAEIARDLEVQASQIAKEMDLQLKEQDRQIKIAEKARAESAARAAADVARAEAAKAEASIATAHRLAEAERAKMLALLSAQEKAEAESARLLTLAKAERAASVDHAAARMEAAKADADADRQRSAARRESLLAEAEGTRALHEAENVLGDRLIQMKEELARIETLPKALAEMVKPAEKIESIRIHNVTGLGGTGAGGSGSGEGKTPVNQALDSILGMAVQLPALKTLGDELGLSMGGAMKAVKKDEDAKD